MFVPRSPAFRRSAAPPISGSVCTYIMNHKRCSFELLVSSCFLLAPREWQGAAKGGPGSALRQSEWPTICRGADDAWQAGLASFHCDFAFCGCAQCGTSHVTRVSRGQVLRTPKARTLPVYSTPDSSYIHTYRAGAGTLSEPKDVKRLARVALVLQRRRQKKYDGPRGIAWAGSTVTLPNSQTFPDDGLCSLFTRSPDRSRGRASPLARHTTSSTVPQISPGLPQTFKHA